MKSVAINQREKFHKYVSYHHNIIIYYRIQSQEILNEIVHLCFLVPFPLQSIALLMS